MSSSPSSRMHQRKLSDGMRPLQTLEASVRSPSVKDQDMEVQRLQKTNFNMKLRIFYLEERLAQRAGTDGNQAALEEELFQQKLLIEEKSKELEDRNLLLIKSRNAIESLQTDLELVKAQCHELQDSSVNVSQLENKTRLLELQESKIQNLQLETSKITEEQQNTVRENGALRAEISRCEEQRQQKEVEIRAIKMELEDQVRQVSRLTAELEVARPQLSMQDHMKQALEEKENELDALNLQLDEAKARENGLESELRAVKKREKDNSMKASEIARLEADEIARLHSELETSRRKTQEWSTQKKKLESTIIEKTDLLLDTNKALNIMQQKVGTYEGELKVMKESLRVHDEEIKAENEQKMTELRREHQLQLSKVRQQLIEQGNRLTQIEFSRDEAQRRLASETDELARSRRLCSEMQKRVLEADEARRSDEQSRTLLLDQQIRARETLEHELRVANSEIETLKIEKVSFNQNVMQEASERERHITQQARDFIDLVDKQLAECLKSGASSSSSNSTPFNVASSMDETPAHVMLRRAMARLDVDEGVTAATISSNSSSSATVNRTTPLFPQRSVLHKLYKIQKMKSAFEHVVKNAEMKYVERVNNMEKTLLSKNQQLDRLVQKQHHLMSNISKISDLHRTMDIQLTEKLQADNENQKLQATVEEYKNKTNIAEMEIMTQKKMNEELAIQLSKAGNMVEALKDAQQKLHEKMSKREEQQTMYANELKIKNESAAAALALARTAAAPASSLRESIQNQVRATQNTIDEGSASTLEHERSRYLSTSDLNVSGINRGSSSSNVDKARKVRIHRSGSVDIRFDSEQMAMATAGTTTENQIFPGQQQQWQQQNQNDPKLVELHDKLHDKQEGLELLLRNIRSLVGTTEKFLDRFFKFKGTASTSQREPLGNSSSQFSQRQQYQPNSPAASVLQRDVMTLLDSNARLALQLQALGKDLQTVYRRFKAMEISLAQEEVQRTNAAISKHVNNTYYRRQNDLGPIVEQMQKWGRDLQNAASKLSTSQIRA